MCLLDPLITPHNFLPRSCWPERPVKLLLEGIAEVAAQGDTASRGHYPSGRRRISIHLESIATIRCWVPTSKVQGSGNPEVAVGTPLKVGQLCDTIHTPVLFIEWRLRVDFSWNSIFAELLLLYTVSFTSHPGFSLVHSLTKLFSQESSLALLLGNPA